MTAKKKPDNRTHAQKRRAEAQESIRHKIQGANLLTAIDKNIKSIENEKEKVAKVRNSKADPYKIANVVVKADFTVKATKVQLDAQFKKLNKVLPDLKAMELSDPEGKDPFQGLAAALGKMHEG